MKKTITRKAGQLISRDWLVATGQAVVVAVAQVLIDQIPNTGLKFNWEQILTVSVLVFLNHVVRKSVEPSRTITVEEQDSGEGNPPPLGDPTHPNKT